MIDVWLDDIRLPPDGWVWAKKASEAIDLLKTGKVRAISLDHDLGENASDVGCGYDVASFIEAGAFNGTLPKIPVLLVHSANPVGVAKMKAALRNAQRYWNEPK